MVQAPALEATHWNDEQNAPVDGANAARPLRIFIIISFFCVFFKKKNHMYFLVFVSHIFERTPKFERKQQQKEVDEFICGITQMNKPGARRINRALLNRVSDETETVLEQCNKVRQDGTLPRGWKPLSPSIIGGFHL